MNRAIATLILITATAGAAYGGQAYGQYEQRNADRAQALHAGAGFYNQSTGQFAFGIPPIELVSDALAGQTMPMPPLPQHKPRIK